MIQFVMEFRVVLSMVLQLVGTKWQVVLRFS